MVYIGQQSGASKYNNQSKWECRASASRSVDDVARRPFHSINFLLIRSTSSRCNRTTKMDPNCLQFIGNWRPEQLRKLEQRIGSKFTKIGLQFPKKIGWLLELETPKIRTRCSKIFQLKNWFQNLPNWVWTFEKFHWKLVTESPKIGFKNWIQYRNQKLVLKNTKNVFQNLQKSKNWHQNLQTLNSIPEPKIGSEKYQKIGTKISKNWLRKLANQNLMLKIPKIGSRTSKNGLKIGTKNTKNWFQNSKIWLWKLDSKILDPKIGLRIWKSPKKLVVKLVANRPKLIEPNSLIND